MSEPPETPVKPDRDTLKPDTFWELIEKLLLHSSRDEQTRIRHNVSLSALCRGHALPRKSRDKKSELVERKPNKYHDFIKVPKTNEAETKDKTVGESKHTKGSIGTSKSAKKTKSECNISDLDVIFLKDPKVPDSEQLWRFAIRNRQQKQETEIVEEKLNPIPSARSNEAIFEGLKKRLEDARNEENAEPVEITPRKKPKPKRRTRKVTKHQCKRPGNNGVVSDCAKSNENKSNSVSNLGISPLKGTAAPLVKQHAGSPSSAHDSRHLHVKHPVETSDSACSNLAPVQFESTKSQYDTVLKKRLNCGNKLERMNREIVGKKMNPRLALSRDTTRKYMELKSDYLNLCYQESSLRHQIAILQAEIYMMQNKNFHKRPAVVKTIILDSKSANIPQKADPFYSENHTNGEDNVLLFPPLKPPKPLITSPQKLSYDHFNDRMGTSRKPGIHKEVSFCSKKSESSDGSCTSFPCIDKSSEAKGVCSLYSLTASLKPPPKRQPTALLIPDRSLQSQIETTHRLPKMASSISTCTKLSDNQM